MKARYLFVLITGTLLACNSTPKPTGNDSAGIPAMPVDSPAAAAVPLPDSLQMPDYEDSTLPLKLISQSFYHGDEVPPNTTALNWLGLFQGKDGFYIAAAHLSTKLVEDPVLDEEGQKTGIEVSSDNPDSAFLFITRNEFIGEGPVKAVHVLDATKDYGVEPGKDRQFELNGNRYTIYATANKTGEPGNYQYTSYRLFLKATIKGDTKTQLLGASMSMDDQLMNVLFAGDIDGDGLLDFILETSNHYNVMAPTLYLSKPAEQGKLLKLMGINYSVGC